MANGKTHALANLTVLAATLYIVAPRLPVDLATGATVGAILGTLTTPDLDLIGTTHEEYRIYRWFGWLGVNAWQLFWRGYAKTHPHRGSSHAPIIGTWGRWWYVVIRLSPIIALALYQLWPFWLSWMPALLAAFVFNVLQDITHLILDGWKYYPERQTK